MTIKKLNPNLLHLRPIDEDGETPPNGGVTIAYDLVAREGKVVALCGVSHCSGDDAFKRQKGTADAKARLLNFNAISPEDFRTQAVEIVDIEEVKDFLQAFVESDQGYTLVPYSTIADKYTGETLCLHESDYSVSETLSHAVVQNIATYRYNTYDGDDEFILDEIESMMADYFGDDGEEDDDDTEAEDEDIGDR